MFNVKVVGADQSADSTATGVKKELVACAAPARLFSAVAYNNGTAGDLYFQIFDAAAEPAEGTVPKLVVAVLATKTSAFDFGDGVPLGAGIYVCLSSTDTTKTKVGSDVGLFCVTFRKTE